MDLTVVIAVKDRTENLAYCEHSIAYCDPKPRLIVVDFGSAKPVRLQTEGKVIRVVRDTALFHKARALNIGIRAVQTPYTLITDVDQIFQPNFFHKVMQNIEHGFVRCLTDFADLPPKFDPYQFDWKKYRQYRNTVLATATKKPHGVGNCQGVKTSWLHYVKGFDETYRGWGYEDKDLNLRAKLAAWKMMHMDDTSMIHLPHARNPGYFRNDLILKNKARFLGKRDNKGPIVNAQRKWGEL